MDVFQANERMADLREVDHVEIIIAADDRLWVNVDGICIARITKFKSIDIIGPAGGTVDASGSNPGE